MRSRTFAHLFLFVLLATASAFASAKVLVLQPSIHALNRMQILTAEALADDEQARAAWHDGNSAQVTFYVGRVQTLVQLIRSRMPAAEFHAMLRAIYAVINFEDNKQVLALFPRLFHSLDDLPQIAPTLQARAALLQARKDLRKPNRAAALRALSRADNAFNNPYLTPPLKNTEHDLQATTKSLIIGNNLMAASNLSKLATALMNLHHALATYPFDISPPQP